MKPEFKVVDIKTSLSKRLVVHFEIEVYLNGFYQTTFKEQVALNKETAMDNIVETCKRVMITKVKASYQEFKAHELAGESNQNKLKKAVTSALNVREVRNGFE